MGKHLSTSKGKNVMKTHIKLLFLGFLVSGIIVPQLLLAQSDSELGKVQYVEFVRFIDENGNSSCRQVERSAEEMAALEEAKSKLGLVV